MLKNEAEILPLHSEDGIFYAINAIDVLDCIDYKKSEYKTFRDGKRIMRFTKYSFIESIIKNHRFLTSISKNGGYKSLCIIDLVQQK